MSLHDRGNIIYQGEFAAIVNPAAMHIPREDGGHLLVMPVRQVSNRTKLRPEEMLEVDYLSIIAAGILRAFLGADWINFQENGNWDVDRPATQHMHLHVYGRKQHSRTQIFGEALRFPARAEKETLSFTPFSNAEILPIQKWIAKWRESKSARAFEQKIAAR